jgi:hypothetical protein
MMAKNGVHNTNIKGFKVDIAQANWNVVWIVYGSGDVSELMIDKERTYYFH